MLDNLEDELLVIDRNNRIIEVNEAVVKAHGKRREEIIGQLCYEVSHGSTDLCHPPYHECPITAVIETGKPCRVTHAHLYRVDGKESTKFLDIIASPIRDNTGNVVAVVELLRDVTIAKEMESKVATTHKNLLALNSIAAAVTQSLNLDVVLNTALDKILELMNETIGGILLWNEEKQLLVYRVYRGLSDNYIKKMRCRIGEGIAGTVAQKGEAIQVEDISSDTRVICPDVIKTEGLKSFASFPLKSQEKILGVLNIASRKPRTFSQDEIQLLTNITAQIAIAVENAKLHQEVQQKDEIRSDLLREIFAIQEEERRRIARELHDETSQSLASLAANLEASSLMLPEHSDKIKAKLKDAQNLSLNILDEIHRLIYELRPTVLDDLGLVSALRWLVDNNLGKIGMKVNFEVKGKTKRISSHAEATIFRTVQEAVNNIARHSRGKHTWVTINFKKLSVHVSIKDDGRGFNVTESINSKRRPRGLGLLGMIERIELINGNITIDSHAGGKGTEIQIEIPIM
jgi:PAS domain S-box-containing protein